MLSQVARGGRHPERPTKIQKGRSTKLRTPKRKSEIETSDLESRLGSTSVGSKLILEAILEILDAILET